MTTREGTVFTAQCHRNGICYAVSKTLEPLDPSQFPDIIFVPLESYDESVKGKYWNGVFWEDVVP